MSHAASPTPVGRPGGQDVLTVFYGMALPNPEGAVVPSTLIVNLEGPSDLFSDNSIPLGLTLDDFNDGGIVLQWTDGSTNFIEAELTAFSLDAVIPAPGAWMLAPALLGTRALRRRR